MIKNTIHIQFPALNDLIHKLRAGQQVLISGKLYTARDAAHQRMINSLNQGENLPFEIDTNAIYYVGPTPTKPGQIIGSAGPTTSYRMDNYTPPLLDLGLKAMIGKGNRSQEVVTSIKKNAAVYLGAIGGAAALLSKSIKSCRIIAYEDLGTEAIHELYVENFPATVIIDTLGNNLLETGPLDYMIFQKNQPFQS